MGILYYFFFFLAGNVNLLRVFADERTLGDNDRAIWERRVLGSIRR